MKKLLIVLALLSTVTLMSCDDGAFDPNVCYHSVRAKYPNAKIYHEPGSNILYWTVIDTDGTYYRVKTGTDQVTNVVKETELK